MKGLFTRVFKVKSNFYFKKKECSILFFINAIMIFTLISFFRYYQIRSNVKATPKIPVKVEVSLPRNQGLFTFICLIFICILKKNRENDLTIFYLVFYSFWYGISSLYYQWYSCNQNISNFVSKWRSSTGWRYTF